MDKANKLRSLLRIQSIFITLLSLGYLTLFILPSVSMELNDRLGETKFLIFSILGLGCLAVIVLRAYISRLKKQIAVTGKIEVEKVLNSNESGFRVGIFLALIFLLIFFSWLGLFALGASEGRPSSVIFAIIFYGGILVAIITALVRLLKNK